LLFIAALVALSVFALAGAASASATMLCDTNEESCVSEDRYAVPATFETKLKEKTEGVFTASVKANCKASALVLKTTNEEEGGGSESPLVGEVSSFTLTECSGCATAEALNLPYKASIVPVSGKTEGNGVLTLEGTGKGNPSVKLSKCALGASCTFGAAKVTANVKGGETAHLNFESSSLSYEGGSGEGSCGKTATWAQDMQVVPVDVWVSRSTVLCEQNVRPCPPTKDYLVNTVLEAKLETGTKAKWVVGGETVECSTSTLVGKTTRRLGVKGEITPSFTCQNRCEVEPRNLGLNLSYVMNMNAVQVFGMGNGRMEILNMSVKIRCKNEGGKILWECQYGKAKLFPGIDGNGPAKLNVALSLDKEGGTCAATTTWTGAYFFERQSPMFLI
jgi:hypothetical protein